MTMYNMHSLALNEEEEERLQKIFEQVSKEQRYGLMKKMFMQGLELTEQGIKTIKEE